MHGCNGITSTPGNKIRKHILSLKETFVNIKNASFYYAAEAEYKSFPRKKPALRRQYRS